jgi:membrane fusion protein, heavy metal efflux system
VKLNLTPAWVALWVLGGSAWAAPPLGCLIEPDRVAEVGSPVIGVIETINVERGDRVRKGQVLATLRADVERASINVAAMRAQAEADVRGAQANFEFMRDKQARAEDLVKKNFISRQALDQARTETSVAEQRLAQAREQQRISQRELDLARAQLEMRSIRAPFDGIVADRYLWPGERVEEKPLLKLAKVDPLRIEVVVPAAMFGTLRPGSMLNVTPELSNVGTVTAKVVLVDTLMDAASNTFRARAELPNPNAALPSGLRCKAELAQQGALAKGASSSRKSEPALSRGVASTAEMQFAGLKLDPTVSLPKSPPSATPRRAVQ